MTTMTYAQRLKWLHHLCMATTMQDGARPVEDLNLDFEAMDVSASAHYLASYVTFNAIQSAGRQPGEELQTHFDMIGVYQCYALMVFAFLMNPVAQPKQQSDAAQQPDYVQAQITIAKTLFDGIPQATLAEIIDAGYHKFRLIAEAEAEHWQEYRENLDKVTISFVVAGTDEQSPHSMQEVMPLFGQLLSQLCEAFSAD